MFKLQDFRTSRNVLDDKKLNFLNIYKIKWDEIHNKSDVFRYRIDNLRERIVDGKYLLQLNPHRSTKRRAPEQIHDICQPFDKNKFNFTKVSRDEIIFTFTENDDEENEHALLVNVSPISRYHSLLCPLLKRCLPQILTADSLQLAIDIIFLSEDRDLRIGFNSLCGLASVNHLHYHLFIENNVLPVETVKCNHIKGPVYSLSNDYPVPAFCFEVTPQSVNPSGIIFRLIEVLLNKSIAHNIFITHGQRVTGDSNREDIVRVIIWPRKSSSGTKQLSHFNVAVCELSGWFPIYDEDIFEYIQTEELETELKKWKYENFAKLCEEIKELY
ncbi:unnamed protein product [Parnassius apollo]|uniref:GDP-D-glucose phosphorylase 1 n=1 Tax=Parnassius apollo TaxID=110799 RepID=A0A8S3YBD3_PARAO|nr:unnamed protein product [Parnassius apollo]